MHVVRLLREVCDVPAVPGGHAERRDGQLPRGQPAVLDADPGMSSVFKFVGIEKVLSKIMILSKLNLDKFAKFGPKSDPKSNKHD